jgi:hypothetical protein
MKAAYYPPKMTWGDVLTCFVAALALAGLVWWIG